MSLDGLMNERGALPIHIGGGVVCAVLVLMGWLLGVKPLLADNHQNTAVVKQADTAEQEAQQHKLELDRLTAELERVRGRLDQQPVTLENASQINPLLAQLAGWSEAHDISITRTNSGQPVEMAYYDYVPISLAGEGGYTDLLSFMHRLHHDRGDLGIVSFNASRLAGQAGVSFGIELAWYVISDVEAADRGQATAAVQTD